MAKLLEHPPPGEVDALVAYVDKVKRFFGWCNADQAIRAAWGDGELEPFAGRVGIGGLKFLQELACLAGPVGRLPVLVAATSGRTGRRPRRPGPGAGTGATPAAVWSAP